MSPTTSPDPVPGGRWLRLACAAWLAAALFALTVFAVGIPHYFTEIQTNCTGSGCVMGGLNSGGVHALRNLGISTGGYAVLEIVLEVGTALGWILVGALIFWRRSDEWVALLVALQLVTQGASQMTTPLEMGHTAWEFPALALDFSNATLLFLVFSLFPNGRFVPRWIRWLALAFVAFQVTGYLLPVTSILGPVGWFGFMGSLVVAQICRYRKVSGPVERQQTKWVVSGFTAIIGLQLGVFLPTFVSPALGSPDSSYIFVVGTLEPLILLLGPLSIGTAILRYRLWDIDVIINRALVYGALTGTLAAVYFGGVVLVQRGLHALTGQSSQLAVVASTLLIAALFGPLRRQIQALIDRRFYRRKYDATKTLEAFSARLREKTDLDQLGDDLVDVVDTALQPEYVSLWLRNPEHKG